MTTEREPLWIPLRKQINTKVAYQLLIRWEHLAIDDKGNHIQWMIVVQVFVSTEMLQGRKVSSYPIKY